MRIKSIAKNLMDNVPKVLNSILVHLNPETRDLILGDSLSSLAGGSTGKGIIEIALYADVFRVVYDTITADTEISQEEIDECQEFVISIAHKYAKVRPKYAKFADATRENIPDFLALYASDGGPCGYLNDSTKWAGMNVCLNVTRHFGAREVFDNFRSLILNSVLEMIATVEYSDQEQAYYEELESELQLLERRATDNNSDKESSHHLTAELVQKHLDAQDDHFERYSSLNTEAAEILSRLEGELYLDGLTTLSNAAAESLSRLDGVLRLNGLANLSDAAAESLGRHVGGLGLKGLTSLSDAAAESLSRQVGNLSINGLTSLSDPAAEPTHRKKEIYLSQNTFVNPVTLQQQPQSSNRIRMAKNGAGELTYFNWSGTVAGSDVSFIYNGGNSLVALVIDRNASVNYARPTAAYTKNTYALSDLNVVPANWNGWTMQYSGVAYDSMMRRTAKSDALGRTELFQIDPSNGAVTQTTHFDSTTSSSTFNAFFQPLVVTDRLGRVTKNEYDVKGNLTKKTEAFGTPLAGVWEWTFNTRGQPLTAKDANGNVTDYAYYEVSGQNGFRRLKSITEPADTLGAARAVTQFEYDAAGRLTKTTDPTGRQTVFAYDGRNRRTSITYYDTSTETFTYGSGVDAGLLVEKKDRDGAIEKCVFDGHGRQTSCTTAFGTSVATVRSTTYLSGTELPLSVTVSGETTSFGYDNENKRITVARQVRGGLMLTSTTFYDVEDRQSHVSDPYGRKTYVVYDINDRVSRTVQETVPNALTVPAGQAARDTYLNGLTRNLGPNATYLISDASYDAQGQLLTQTDPRGVVRKTTYDARGRTFEQFEAFGTPEEAKTQMAYDPQGNPLQILSPRHFTEAGGFITEMTYTARNLLATRTVAKNRPEQATESWTYFLDRQEQNHVDFRGNTSTKSWGWCCARLQGTITPPASVDTSGVDKRSVRTMRYSFAGDLTHSALAKDIANVTFPTGQNQFLNVPDSETLSETTTKFDARHRPVATTRWLSPRGAVNPDSVPIAGDSGIPASEGLTTRWTYDDNLTDGSGLDQLYATQIAALGPNYFATGSDGSAVQITNPAGETSAQFFDALGRVILSIDGQGNTSQMSYDTVVSGLLQSSSIDPLGNTTSNLTDAAGRVHTSIDAIGQSTQMQYDAQGSRISVRDANNTGEDCVYDARARKIQCTDTFGAVTAWGFDTESNQISFTDAKGSIDTCQFDGRNRKIQCTDRIGGITRFTFDANSNLLSLEDADAVAAGSGKKTLYVYDARNRKISEAFPGHNAAAVFGAVDYDKVLFAYDAMDRMTARIDQSNQQIGYAFDLAGRMTTRSYPDNQNDTFTYDNASRMLTAASARYANTVTKTYNTDGTLASESLATGGKTYPVTYGYDAANRNTSLTYPSGKVVTRNYTARNELSLVTYSNINVVTRTYDNGGRLATSTYGNGLVESRTYRTDNLLSSIVTPGITNLAYTWDANKNKTGETDGLVNPYSWTTGIGGYDSIDRLIGWNRSNGNSQQFNLSKVGDWNSVAINGITENRTHNAVHELTVRDTANLGYDPRGNLVTKSETGSYYSSGPGITTPSSVQTTWTYTWDYDNRLQHATDSEDGRDIVYRYDALGRRISKIDGTETTDATIFISALNQEIAEYKEIASVTSPTYDYVFGSYIDEVLMRIKPPISTTLLPLPNYYHADAQYSVRTITNRDAAVVERYAYDPYGAVIYLTASGTLATNQSSSIGNTILYTGRRLDTETGLFYYRARYYDTKLGRFIGRDPLTYKGSEWNLYEFLDSQVFVKKDPSGQSTAPFSCRGIRIRKDGGSPYNGGTLMCRTLNPVGPPPIGNGCGSGWNAPIVPDGEFGAACFVHDACYGTCGSDKANCDANFYDEMMRACRDAYLPYDWLGYQACSASASTYYQFVNWLGNGPFERGQDGNCDWKPCPRLPCDCQEAAMSEGMPRF
jgi:RHS repeat-associated protein